MKSITTEEELEEMVRSEENMGSDDELSDEEDDGMSDDEDDGFEDGDGNEENDVEEEEDVGVEEEEDVGVEETDENEANDGKRKLEGQGGGQAKMQKTQKLDGRFYKIPTVDELSMLRETQVLYHSNLFRLQMEEVLGETSMKDKHRFQLERWLTQFTAFAKGLNASAEYPLFDKSWMTEKKIGDPMLSGIPEVKATFNFSAPISVECAGAFTAGTVTTQKKAVDVMLVLPRECVKFLDINNGRWLMKRSRYLAWLAAELKDKTELVTDMVWTTHLGCSSRPVLQVTPAGSVGKKWKVNLFPVPFAERFKRCKFAPNRGHLLPEWFLGEDMKKGAETPPSPMHNWAFAVDVFMAEHSQLLRERISEHPNVVQGVKLLKIWLTQRGLDKGLGCVSGHLMSFLVVHLINKKKINIQMSPYQVFRSTMLSLSSEDWTTKGVAMRDEAPEKELTLETFHSHYEVVFVDPSGFVNLAANLSAVDFQGMKHEAQLALDILSSSASESFEALFIKKVEVSLKCDQLASIKLTESDVRRIHADSVAKSKNSEADYMTDVRVPVWSAILNKIQAGLGERATLLVPLERTTQEWPLDKPQKTDSWSLNFGLILNPSTAFGLLTKGPAADAVEAGEFRAFWGGKSSMRRFQDGSFHEAVLWADPKDPQATRRLIPGRILEALVKQHFGLDNNSVQYVAGQTEALLHLHNCLLDYEYGTGEESTNRAIQSLDRFSRALRSLDLPLKITSVHPLSEVSRHARVFPPIGKGGRHKKQGLLMNKDHYGMIAEDGGFTPTFVFSMNVIIFLEMSGKWPDDLLAIQAIKTEFYNKMAKLLKATKVRAIVHPTYLQVLWEEYVIHIEVCYRREIYLRRLVETPDAGLKEQDTDAAIALEKQIEIMPKITSSLTSIQSEHPSFSGGVRLAKRWVGAQMMLSHLPHLAVELLVGYLYIRSAPYQPPHTPHVALLRFLHLLAHTDWKTCPILVNLSQAFTVEDEAELNRRFTSNRNTLPALFIATPHDLRRMSNPDNPDDVEYRYRLASCWTKDQPTPQILFRFRQLAQAALALLGNMMNPSLDYKAIFRPSLQDFDITIKLNRGKLSRREEAVDAPPMKRAKLKKVFDLSGENEKLMPIVMYDPAFLYIKELRAAYRHLALFFYDEHGGDVIGVVWNPQAITPQELKVGSLKGHQLVGVKEIKQVANVDAIVEDFKVMGAGLVSSITIKNE